MTYHIPSAIEKKVCKQFLQFVKEMNFDKVQQMLDNFETSQYIHVQTLAKSLTLNNSKEFYVSDLKRYIDTHMIITLDGINKSIINNDFKFFSAHFLSYADWSLSGVYANKDNQWEKLLILACSSDNNDVVKYLLTNEKILTKPDIHWNNQEALRIAYGRNNLELVAFLLYSPDIEEHSFELISYINYSNPNYQSFGIPSQESINFLKSYKNDMEVIDKIFKEMTIAFEQKNNEEFMNYFDKGINNLPLSDYLIKQREIINQLLIKATKNNNQELVHYFIHSNHLPYNPIITYEGNNNAFQIACEHNHLDLVKYFIKAQANNTSTLSYFEISSGLMKACENNAQEVVDYFCKNTSLPSVSAYFIKACQKGHYNLAKYFVEHKNQSEQLYLHYPFESIVEELIPSKKPTMEIKEENIIKTIDYLYQTKEFLPLVSNENIGLLIVHKFSKSKTKEEIFLNSFQNAVEQSCFLVADHLRYNYSIKTDEQLFTSMLKKYIQYDKPECIEYLIYQCGLRKNKEIVEFFEGFDKTSSYSPMIKHTEELFATIESYDNISSKINLEQKQSLNKAKKKI